MTFLWHSAPPLSDHINFLYAARGSMPYRHDGIFPTASTDLKINFGDAWHVRDQPDGAASSCRESWCLGIWNRRYLVEWPDHTDFVGVSFKPGGAHAFLGVPLSELHNRVVPLDAIWGRAAADIRDRLAAAATPEQRFALLETFLLARLRDRSEASPVVDHVTRRIAERHGGVRVGALCQEAGISHKHLITLFNRLVGCTPKELARLYRFQHTLERIDIAGPVRRTTLAHEGDYFDQSHFSRDFAAYTGLNPTDYLRRRQGVHARAPDHAKVPWLLPAGQISTSGPPTAPL